MVVSLWDWGSPTTYLHDAVSTDRRNPRVNANGKIYGTAEDSQDVIPVLDPVTHTASVLQHPVRDPDTPSSKGNAMAPSPYWGADPIWDSKTLNHNPMLDEKGRVWSTPAHPPGGQSRLLQAGIVASLGADRADRNRRPEFVVSTIRRPANSR